MRSRRRSRLRRASPWATRCESASCGVSIASPKAAAKRPAIVVAALTVICWPRIARTASSNPSKAPGTRSPGRCDTAGPRIGSRAKCALMMSGRALTSKRLLRRSRSCASIGVRVGAISAASACSAGTSRTRIHPVCSPIRTVRRYASSCTDSTPFTERALRKRSRRGQSSGAVYGSRAVCALARCVERMGAS